MCVVCGSEYGTLHIPSVWSISQALGGERVIYCLVHAWFDVASCCGQSPKD